MSNDGAALGAAVPVSNARAEASRKNGAKSRGPKTAAGKARSAQNALRHGMRALQYVVLPDEDAVEFQTLEAALLDELAPEGALQVVLARRVAVAAWRLARADRMEVELFEERRWEDAGVGMALIRDGNGTRSFETLLRYRGAAMAEFWRALKTLKALQAEPAAVPSSAPIRAGAPVAQLRAGARAAAAPTRSAPRGRRSPRTERTRAPPRMLHLSADQSTSCPTLPDPAACCTSPRRPGFRTNPSQRSRSRRRRRCRSRTGIERQVVRPSANSHHRQRAASAR